MYMQSQSWSVLKQITKLKMNRMLCTVQCSCVVHVHVHVCHSTCVCTGAGQ